MIKVKVTQVSLHCYSGTSVLRILTISSGKRRDTNLQQAKTVFLSTLEMKTVIFTENDIIYVYQQFIYRRGQNWSSITPYHKVIASFDLQML